MKTLGACPLGQAPLAPGNCVKEVVFLSKNSACSKRDSFCPPRGAGSLYRVSSYLGFARSSGVRCSMMRAFPDQPPNSIDRPPCGSTSPTASELTLSRTGRPASAEPLSALILSRAIRSRMGFWLKFRAVTARADVSGRRRISTQRADSATSGTASSSPSAMWYLLRAARIRLSCEENESGSFSCSMPSDFAPENPKMPFHS